MVIPENIREEKADAPTILKKILTDSLKNLFSKEAVCVLFSFDLLHFVFPVESECWGS